MVDGGISAQEFFPLRELLGRRKRVRAKAVVAELTL